ncbi:MAG: Fe-S cluster domain-containing protein [Prolixibacteraceae bacterium]|jgi:Na+-translocating ferredoxin:NAD+ oxidoreductase RNF subunit RnfB
MSTIIIYTILTLSIIGILSAIILYFVAQKFKVYEDPRIDQVEAALPGANCGGCGYAGCRAFAETCVSKGELADLFCPVGGNETMTGVAGILGIVAEKKDPRVAVVRCNGTCEHRPKTNVYDGTMSCAVAASLYSGDTGCQYGCLGCGDCVTACDFDAIHMNPETGLPEVDDDKCVACGACVKACPKTLIELRKKAPKGRKIYVSCRNMDKGAVARKSCSVACIGCSKCEKECAYDAITMANNLAFIDSDKCKLCRKCVSVCPTNAIIELNFPPRKITVTEPVKVVAEKVKPDVSATNVTEIKPESSEN